MIHLSELRVSLERAFPYWTPSTTSGLALSSQMTKDIQVLVKIPMPTNIAILDTISGFAGLSHIEILQSFLVSI